MAFERRRGEYLVSSDATLLDLPAIHDYLSRSYWAQGIPREVVERSLAGSLCFGLFHQPAAGGSSQAGFARAITDRATYAYLADVYVLEAHRGAGLGVWLMECVMEHPELQGLRRWSLVTRDAHGLYRRFGFRELAQPEMYMEIVRRKPSG